MDITDRSQLHDAIRGLEAGGARHPLTFRGEIAKAVGRAMNVVATAQRKGRLESGPAHLGVLLGAIGVIALPVGAPVVAGVAVLTALTGAVFGTEWAKQRGASALRTALDTPYGPEAALLQRHGYAIRSNYGDLLELAAP